MLHNKYDRLLNSDFKDLQIRLSSLYDVFNVQERFMVVFDDNLDWVFDGGAVGEVVPSEVKHAYLNSVASTYGSGENIFGINFSRVLYVAHTHPFITGKYRPSGGDFLEGGGDYEITKLYIPCPHYVVDSKYIYCLDYEKDSQVITNRGVDVPVSFAGRWEWQKFIEGQGFVPMKNSIYISDEHFDPEDPDGVGYRVIDDDTQHSDTVPEGTLTVETGILEIDQNGTIELISK